MPRAERKVFVTIGATGQPIKTLSRVELQNPHRDIKLGLIKTGGERGGKKTSHTHMFTSSQACACSSTMQSFIGAKCGFSKLFTSERQRGGREEVIFLPVMREE